MFVKTGDDGAPLASRDGRVEIRYQLKAGSKAYRAALRNLEATGEAEDEKPVAIDVFDKADEPGGGEALEKDAIIIYTDGACTGNPGPAGIGAVILDGEERREISEYLGEGTNNIAELVAIERALEAVAPEDARQVVVHSDSSYAIGLLSKGWKPKANVELVGRIRALTAAVRRLRFVKVKGHAGIPENERCDELARDAITRRA
ncbi:ribonuclease HI [Haliangium ochraceum]|uniref:ribonuclease HI n=1 Tax=Haliangium ochraceum TaxID=80816 RepID=UPI00019B9836|nr:ribonuclease H [Haliangium ochraceum]